MLRTIVLVPATAAGRRPGPCSHHGDTLVMIGGWIIIWGWLGKLTHDTVILWFRVAMKSRRPPYGARQTRKLRDRLGLNSLAGSIMRVKVLSIAGRSCCPERIP